MLQTWKACRRCSVPVVAVATSDPWQTVTSLSGVVAQKSPVIEWDVVRGMTAKNEPGREAIVTVLKDGFDATIGNPVAMLVSAVDLPAQSVLYMHLAQRFLQEPSVVQGISNLRNLFKLNRRTLVLLGASIALPAELQHDVVILDEPLPNETLLGAIVSEQAKSADVKIKPDIVEKAVEALLGLSAFEAEQVTAMCLTKTGIDLDSLWERKRKQIEQTPAIKVYRGKETFADVGGCDCVKGFLSRILAGSARPNAVVFVDEIEKCLAGANGDTSGVSKDQLGVLLSYMQDHNACGVLFVGPPGAAKSAVAKATGAEAGIPTIQLDLGGAKGSLVGQSEHQIRDALKVITSVSNGRSLWIATCNGVADLPPELRRRFTLGTFFFDLPTEAERGVIWNLYRAKYGIDEMADPVLPNDTDWTGAEIKQCCEIAWRLRCTLADAAAYIVPVARSAAEAIARLRQQADGRFLSATHGGMYQQKRPAAAVAQGRSISHLDEE